MSETIETWFDQPLLFTISERHVRGRLVRLGPALNTIIAAHNYPPVAEKLLAEALALTVLLGSTLKDEGSQLTLQAQTGGGPVDATTTPNLFIFNSFRDLTPYATSFSLTASLLLFVVLGVISIVMFRLINSDKAVDG